MGYAMKGSPRWKQAAIDADVNVENIARIFSPVVGVKINKSDTPEIWDMLQDLLKTGGYHATAAAKEYYMCPRPFVVFEHRTCCPEDEDGNSGKAMLMPVVMQGLWSSPDYRLFLLFRPLWKKFVRNSMIKNSLTVDKQRNICRRTQESG